MKPVYLDTNALIHLVEREEYGLRSFVRRVNGVGRRLVTSEMTLAEILVKPLREANHTLVATYEALLSEDEGIVLAASPHARQCAEVLRYEHSTVGILIDSIHVATAEILGCEAIISSDKRLRLPRGLVRIPIADLDASL